MVDLRSKFKKSLKELDFIDKKPASYINSNEDLTYYFNSFSKNLIIKITDLKKMMLDNRERYFSNATFLKGAFSEQQKDEIDKNIMEVLKDCEKNLKKLKETHNNCSNKTEFAHKEIALSCLYKRLQEVSLLFKEFKTFRFQEINRVNDLINLNPNKNLPCKLPKQKSTIKEEQVENEKFHKQNEILLIQFENDVEKVKDAQKRLYEISQLITTFSNKVVEQDLTTDMILDNAFKSVDYIEDANKNLIDANKYSEEFGKRWALCFIIMGVFLLIFDRIWK